MGIRAFPGADHPLVRGAGEFFLNRGIEGEPVQAPAFSLTKVMATVASLVTTLVAVLTAALPTADFSNAQITTLLVALLGFLAVTGAADVLARAVAASARHASTSAARERLLRFPTPLAARLTADGAGPAVSVIAAAGPEYLCVREDGTLSWEPAGTVRFPSPARQGGVHVDSHDATCAPEEPT